MQTCADISMNFYLPLPLPLRKKQVKREKGKPLKDEQRKQCKMGSEATTGGMSGIIGIVLKSVTGNGN